MERKLVRGAVFRVAEAVLFGSLQVDNTHPAPQNTQPPPVIYCENTPGLENNDFTLTRCSDNRIQVKLKNPGNTNNEVFGRIRDELLSRNCAPTGDVVEGVDMHGNQVLLAEARKPECVDPPGKPRRHPSPFRVIPS